MAFGALSVKGRALRYLAQREHSRVELARKLARTVVDSDTASASQQIQSALDELAAHGLLNEERAAASVLNIQGRSLGERRLKQNLQNKGFAPELVAQTLAQVRDTELDRARALWQRKYGAPPQDARARAKQMRFMLGRGFSSSVIVQVLRDSGCPAASEDGELGLP
jgi:regulatory protein